MSNAKQVGGLVGPAIVAILVSEFPLVQHNLYAAQIPPVIYLSGFLLVVALIITFKSYSRSTT